MRHSLSLLPVVALACGGAELEPPTLPARAPSVVVAASLSAEGVSLHGRIPRPGTVDVDALASTELGFRYQLLDGGGEVIYERGVLGPILVQEFLAYHSAQAGIDVLASVPSLGRFTLQIPDLERTQTVRFQRRNDNGSFDTVGEATLDSLPWLVEGSHPAVVGHETLWSSGDSDNRLDLAILGDGYTEAQQGQFADHAQQVADALLQTPPFSEMADRINIHRVDVVSAESGAGFDCSTCGARDTALGSIFAVEAVNRISGSSYDSRAIFQADQWGTAHAAGEVPWDQLLVLVNTERFGGMSVHFATATTGHYDWLETAVHELGHGIGDLGDEYVADDCIRSDALGLPANISASATELPWGQWVDEGTPLPTEEKGVVGAFEGAYNCRDLYRPMKNCMMRSGDTFCPVCAEQLVRKMLRFSDPAAGFEADGSSYRVTDPMSDAVAEWYVNGKLRKEAPATEEVRLSADPSKVTLRVRYGTDTVRVEAGELEERFTAP